MNQPPPPTEEQVDRERLTLLRQIEAMIETPMIILAFIWLALFVIEVIYGLNRFLEIAGYVIWALFIFEYLLGLTVAPRKLAYIRRNWLKGIALVAPALRVFRIFYVLRLARITRAARLARTLRLLRVLSSVNRGMRALGNSMKRRGFGYVVALTVIVVLVGAAGMYTFENDPEGNGLNTYGEALWWTAMIITTLGSQYWPQTPEGRLLCLFLALYSFAVFGYIAGVLASFFVDRDAEDDTAEIAGAKQLEALRREIKALRDELRNHPE